MDLTGSNSGLFSTSGFIVSPVGKRESGWGREKRREGGKKGIEKERKEGKKNKKIRGRKRRNVNKIKIKK